MNRSLRLVFVGIMAVAVAAAYFSGSARWVQLATTAVWFAALGAAWNLQAGFAGVLGLGNTLFLAVGAYCSIYLYNIWAISPWLGMWIGAAISVAVGAAIAFVCLRAGLRGITYVFATFASTQILLFWLLDQAWLGGAGGIRLERIDHDPLAFRFGSDRAYLVVAVVLLACVMGFAGFIRDRRWGLFMRAVRENERAAAMSGVPVLRIQVLAAACSAFFTAIAGTFYAQFQMSVSPGAVLNLQMALNTMIFAVVGGVGFVFGPVVGAFVLTVISEIALHLSGNTADFAAIRLVIYGVCIVGIALFLPGGLVSLGQRRTQE